VVTGPVPVVPVVPQTLLSPPVTARPPARQYFNGMNAAFMLLKRNAT
jgi:hypothetical protein